MNVLILIVILLVAAILVLQLLHLLHHYGLFSRDARKPREAYMRRGSPDYTKSHEYQVLSPWNDKPEESWLNAVSESNDPSVILRKAIETFQQDPGIKNAQLLVRLSNHTNNRIRNDETIDRLIEEISELTKSAFAASVRLFEHTSIAGRQLFIAHTTTSRYLLASGDYLNRFEFNDIASSIRLCTGGAGVPPQMCLLFGDERFGDKFKALAFQEDRNLISLPYYNDLTSSVMLVSHDPEQEKVIISLRDSAGKDINDVADSLINELPGLIRTGDVLLKFCIDAFEIGHFGNDMVKVEIPLEYHPPYLLKGSNVSISFYIDLFLSRENELKSALAGWHYRVEAGILAKDLESRLKRYVPGMADYVESSIGNMLHELNWQRWKDVYLLPGRMNRVDEDYEGDVSDDCTVVLIPFLKK